jgi:predicted RNA-binding Zn ribbon-like protein
VDYNSAVPNGATDAQVIKATADHVRMVKYDTPDDNTFIAVLRHLREIIAGLYRKRKDREDPEDGARKRPHIGTGNASSATPLANQCAFAI